MRGEIWWADFGEPVGTELGYRRPAVIVSSDRFNRSRIATVIVSTITSNLRLAAAPGNVELDEGAPGSTAHPWSTSRRLWSSIAHAWSR